MKIIKWGMKFLLLIGLCIFVFYYFLVSEKKGSIFGKIKADKTNEGIPNVEIVLEKDPKYDLDFKKTIVTDSEGKYSFDSLEPSIYWIRIVPNVMYCREFETIEIKKNENQQCDFLLESAGILKGKVYKKKGKDLTPIPDAKIDVFCYPHYEETISNIDGSYILGRINPDCTFGYRLRLDSKLKNMAYKIKNGIHIFGGLEQIENIIIDLDDTTAVEGYIKSSIDGGPIQNVHIYFEDHYGRPNVFGKTISDQGGYFIIFNLEEMNYKVIFNLISHPQKKYNLGDIQREIYVQKGKKQKFDVYIDVESNLIQRGEK